MAVRKTSPLRLSALPMLAFVVPLWVLPFLPPWPVVFVALFAAMFCTPLINGPLIAVLTSRTPDELRAMVITAVISINTLAAPLGFVAAGLMIERWGVARSSPPSLRGLRGWPWFTEPSSCAIAMSTRSASPRLPSHG